MNRSTRILQLTDLHLFADKQESMIGMHPYDSLERVMREICKTIKKDHVSLIVLTGDISQDFSLESYKLAADVFKCLDCPILASMGNHDHPSLFAQVFGDVSFASNKVFIKNNWRILILNSHWSGHVSGLLSEDELSFLKNTLKTDSAIPTVIFLHHQVLSVGSVWLDKIGLKNADEFLGIIDQYNNVRAVVCGHVHQERDIFRKNVSFFSTPSTCWQFAVDSDKFKLDTQMPGYRIFDLCDDGSLKTELIRLAYDAKFVPDLESKGY